MDPSGAHLRMASAGPSHPPHPPAGELPPSLPSSHATPPRHPSQPRPPSGAPQPPELSENTDYVALLKRLKPFLGLALSNNPNEGGGVLVVRAVPDSPATLAGLRPGDVICKFNGKSVSTELQFRGCSAAINAGDILLIQYIRSGQKLEATLTVGAVPDGVHDFSYQKIQKLARYARRQRPERTLYSLHPSIGMSFSDTADHSGIRVTSVFPGDAADAAGIQRGDIVVQMDGVPIKTKADFWGIYNASMPGDLISTQIKRGHKYYKVSLVVGAKGLPIDEVKRLTLSKREQVDVSLENRLDSLQKSIGVGFTDDRKSGGLTGVVVCKVKPGQAGDRAGLKVGDVITRMNGIKLRNKDYFWGAYFAARPGDVVPLTVLRHVAATKQDIALELILLIEGKTEMGERFDRAELEALAAASRLTECIRSLYSMIPTLGLKFELARGREGEGVFGVHVLEVDERSASAVAGILPRDIITSIGGVKITSRDIFHGYFSMLRAGQVVPLTVWRQNSARQIHVMVGGKGYDMNEIQALVAASLNYEENHRVARQRSAQTPRNAKPQPPGAPPDISNLTPSGGLNLVMEERGRGLMVTGVVAAEAAQYAGISAGDIIYKFNHVSVRSSMDGFLQVWSRVSVGELLPVELLRASDNKPVRLNFMVGAKEIPFPELIRIKHGELNRQLEL